MKIIYKLLLSVLFASAACVHTDARFIEQGKMWTYVVESSTQDDEVSYKPFSCKIEGSATINGIEYAIVNAYFDNKENPLGTAPYAYLRENDAHDVFVIANKNAAFDASICSAAYYGKEYLLISGEKPLIEGWFFNDSPSEDDIFTAKGPSWRNSANISHESKVFPLFKRRDVYNIDVCPSLMLIDGIGYICENSNLSILFGMVVENNEGQLRSSKLCSVSNNNGQLLYCNEDLLNLIAPISVPYRPFIEQGKRWNYAMIQSNNYGKLTYVDYSLVIDGTTNIEGVEYATVCATKDQLNINAPTNINGKYGEYFDIFCYLREDKFGNVYARLNPNLKYAGFLAPYPSWFEMVGSPELLIHSFLHPELSETYGWEIECLNPEITYVQTSFGEPLKCINYASQYKSSPHLSVIEGVGAVFYDIESILGGNLTDTQSGVPGNLRLYSVEDVNHNVLYHDDAVEALLRTEGIDGISADASDCVPAYYNLQGVQMLDADNLPKGIYIKRTPTKSEKIIVK